MSTENLSAQVSALAGTYGATVRHSYRHALRGFAGTMTKAAAHRLAADPAVARGAACWLAP